MSFIKNPVKKILVGYVGQKVLRKVAPKILPKVIPGGLAVVLLTEAAKYYFDHKNSPKVDPTKVPQAKAPKRKKK